MQININSNLVNRMRNLIGPFEFAVDITNKCNYRCKHCYNASGENYTVVDELSDDEFIALIEDVAKLQTFNVCFCGGEPLLRIDLLCNASIVLHEGGCKNISLVTNGYYMNMEYAQKLKKSHINRIQISLDGASDETCFKLRQNADAYRKAINALRIVSSIGFDNLDVAFCPTNFNVNELESVYNICRKFNVSDLRIQPLMLSGRAEIYQNELKPSKQNYLDLRRKILELQGRSPSMLVSWGDPLDHIFRYSSPEQGLYMYTSVKANGDIPLSPYLPLSLGNIRKHKFSEYWKAGLALAWKLPIAQEYARRVSCIDEMNGKKGEIDTWWEKGIMYDLIENDPFRNIL